MAMTKVHRDVLQGNHVMFVENLILSEELLAVLLAENILTASMLEKVQAERTRSEKVRELMLTLTRRGDTAYRVFLQALIESRQDHLAKCLDPVVAAEFIDERDQKDREAPRTAEVDVESSFNIRWQPGGCAIDEADTAWYDKLFKTDTKELGVELKRMTQDRQVRIEEMMKSKKAYHFSKKNGYFGRAVIINNVQYFQMNPRPGSNVDCEHLKKLFEQLHFEAVVHTDRTSQEMQKILLSERDNQKHHEYSSFVLCILAHGSENKVYGIEGEKDFGAVAIDEITSYFDAVNCPGLVGKPKLFFIQACQGVKDMVAVSVSKAKVLVKSDIVHGALSDGGSHARAVQVNHTQPLSNTQTDTASQPQITEESTSRSLQTPAVADVLVAYSTAPGYKSWRHSDFGTWFIRCLVYVILNNATEDHLLDMLTQVAFIISHFKVECGNKFAIQIPQIVSTLRKKVYFMP